MFRLVMKEFNMASLRPASRYGLPIVQPTPRYGLPIVQPKPFKPTAKVILPIVNPQPIKFGLPIMGRVSFQPMKRK